MEGTFLHMVVFVRSGLLHANCELSTVVIRLWTMGGVFHISTDFQGSVAQDDLNMRQ